MKYIQNEIGDASLQPYPFTSKQMTWMGEWRILFDFTTDKDIEYTAALLENYPPDKKEYEFTFYPKGGNFKDIVNKGELFKVMSTIVAILKDGINQLNDRGGWNKIKFSPSKSFKGDERRANLYQSYIAKNLPSNIKVSGGTNKITFTNLNQSQLKEMKDIQKIKEFFSKPMEEAKKETAVDMAKKQLDALGVKYEMSGNKFKPFKAIYRPTNKPDRWYDEFEDIIHLFNLGSAVKSSMSEAYSDEKVSQIGKDYKAFQKLLTTINYNDFMEYAEMAGEFKTLDILDYLKKKSRFISEAQEEDKVDTITMDVPLFLRMLEYSREDAEQDLDLHDVTEKANVLGKERGILSMEDYEEIVDAAEEIEEGFYGRGDKRRGLQNQSKLSSAEYQMAKKLKSFKASDWKWNADEDLYNKVTEASDYMKRRQAQDDYAVSKKDKPKKSYNPTPSGKTDYMKRREKELAETILAKLKK